jgi:hypothetical protein
VSTRNNDPDARDKRQREAGQAGDDRQAAWDRACGAWMPMIRSWPRDRL